MRVLLVSLFFAAAACNKEVATAPPDAEAQVTAGRTDFTPSEVRLLQGGKVRFVFEGTAHNVIFNNTPGRPDNIENLLSNTVEERVFGTPGTFTFFCRDHTSMTGRVSVEAVTIVE